MLTYKTFYLNEVNQVRRIFFTLTLATVNGMFEGQVGRPNRERCTCGELVIKSVSKKFLVDPSVGTRAHTHTRTHT